MAEEKQKEVTKVKMTDGREVEFVGKRKVLKSTLIDESKISTDADGIFIGNGAIKLQMDFISGETRTFELSSKLLAKYAGHGAEQKFGDELASPASKPLSPEDMLMAVDALNEQLNIDGNWRVVSEGGGSFSGASIVVQAICEASGKPLADVKAFLQKKLDDAKARGESLSRKALYDSFRAPNTKTGKIIERMEKERLSQTASVDADAALAELA